MSLFTQSITAFSESSDLTIGSYIGDTPIICSYSLLNVSTVGAAITLFTNLSYATDDVAENARTFLPTSYQSPHSVWL